MNRHLTGFPSIDKPWLKYYSEEAINAPLPESSLYDYLYECNSEHMDDYALNYFGKKITFREFFTLIDQVAKAFLAIGVHEGDIVPIVSVSTVASILCFYALNRIGAVVDFLNVLAKQNDLVEYFKEADAKFVATLDLFEEKVLAAADECGIEKVISFGVDYKMPLPLKAGYHLKTRKSKTPSKTCPIVLKWAAFLQAAKKQPEIRFTKDPHKMCLLAHTGGTTGEPKAVMLDDCAMNAVVSQYISSSGIKRNGVFLSLIVPFVVYGILDNIHLALCLGLQSVIIPKYDASQWATYLRKYRPNHVLAAPSYISPLLEDKEVATMDLSFFETAGVGGDGMTPELERALNEYFQKHNSKGTVIKGYGMTEVCATAVSCFAHSSKLESVGLPLPKNNLLIYDNESRKELGYNEIGEICLQSPSRMIGYMNNDQATRDLFRIHTDSSEWLHTGDLGYIDEDGFLFLVGRMKRVILTAKDGVTYKIFPNMTERILNENENVVHCCVVGAESGTDQVLRAFVAVSRENLAKTAEIELALRQHCEEKLPSYARPTFYEFRDLLPMTAAGKIDYRALERITDKGD